MSASDTTTIGSVPGTLLEHDGQNRAEIHVIAYGPEAITSLEPTNLDAIPELRKTYPVVWVNVVGLQDTSTLRALGKQFDLHQLALEDVQKPHQRPKLEQYGQQLFVVVKLLDRGERLETEQLSLFYGPGFVLTFQEHNGDCFEPIRDRLQAGKGQMRSRGADYALYALLDAVVDHYFPMANAIADAIEEIEDEVMDSEIPQTRNVQSRLMNIRHDLMLLRRATTPLKTLLSQFQSETLPGISDETRLYLRDCLDHSLRVLDLIEQYREAATHLMDTYLAISGQKLNEIMKVLTIISTIFIPLGFLVGLYGMNFNSHTSPYNMPELNSYWGYPILISFMVILSAVQLYYFRKRGWW